MHRHHHLHGDHIHADRGDGTRGEHGHVHRHGQLDPAITASERGLWAVKWSFAGLLATALLQAAVVSFSGSVALLADTVHNLGDAATAIPLAIAFLVARRPATQRFSFGFGRVEDLAGVAVVAAILVSAIIAAWESTQRLLHPEPVAYPGIVAAAAVIGFLGNELVASFRIRVGKEIGSAALVADGYHARTDGWTSLAVLAGAAGAWIGVPLVDPMVGLAITGAILLVVWQSGLVILTRILDGVDPQVIEDVRHAAAHVSGVRGVTEVRARWVGHRLAVEANIAVDPHLSVAEGHAVATEVEHQLRHHLGFLSVAAIHVDPVERSGEEFHRSGMHQHDGLPEHTHSRSIQGETLIGP